MLETNNSDNWVVFQLFPNHQKKNLNHANSRPQNPKLKPKKKKKKTTPINFHKHPEFQSKWVQQQSNPPNKNGLKFGAIPSKQNQIPNPKNTNDKQNQF